MKQRLIVIVIGVTIVVLVLITLSPAILTAILQVNGDCIKGWEFCH